MPTAGKKVVDEFYVHLSAVEEVEDTAIRAAIELAIGHGALTPINTNEPNVAKVNVRTGRVSLLSYPDFFDSPFPALAASWVFQAGESVPNWHRTYGDSLNPPILHRKELLLSSLHPEHDRWARTTATAEELGLFDDVTTIGFRLNWNRLIHSKGYRLVGDEFLPIGNDVSGSADFADGETDGPIQRQGAQSAGGVEDSLRPRESHALEI